MPHLEIRRPYEAMPHYAHMRPADVEIWNVFIEQNPNRFWWVYYDFRVGEPEEVDHDCLDCVRVAWHDLTRWAVDVIAEDEKAIYVIEIKPHANAKALGQAKSYAELFTLEHTPAKKVVPVVLTDLRIASTAKAAAAMGIEVWVV